MALLQASMRRPLIKLFPLTLVLTAIVALSDAPSNGHQAKVDVLLIGTSGTLESDIKDSKVEKSGMQTLKSFIKEETGFNNEILTQKNWAELGDKLAKGQLHLGCFQGYEFAWVTEKHPDLKPLAMAINVYRYPVACVVVKQDSNAKSFGDLQGQSLGMTAHGERYLRLYLERQCKAAGKNSEAFFAKIARQENIEDILDSVVDGALQVALTDQTALEGYKRRKPGRFNKLKEVSRSQPFPPAVVVSHGTTLDEATLNRVKNGLVGANQKERGQTLLTLFHVTGFETIPDDFNKVLAETRKNYPPSMDLAK
jgi:ABC-type phosphate/phosphonate transport system substrate-binding protein